MTGGVEVAPVRDPRDRESFLRVPWAIYAGQPAWVPPLLLDQRELLDPKRGPFFRESEGELFLARRDGAAVGRIGAFKNHPHLAAHADGAGFFGFFETIDDAAVAGALLAAAAAWLRGRGLRVARGPANFSIYEEAGVLLDGFEHAPMAGMAYTPPYYRGLLEGVGYAKAKDMFVFRLTPEKARLDRIARAAEAVERRPGLRVRHLDMRRLRREAEFLATVYAEAWRDNWGQVPISADEFYDAYRRYRFFVQPELVFLAEIDGEPAAYFVAMPDMNVLLRRMNGRLLPTGIFHLLFGRGGIRQFRVFMMGVRPKFRRLGLPLVFLQRAYAEMLRRRVTQAEFSWVLEDNRETIAIIERIGGFRAQTLRLYEKAIA